MRRRGAQCERIGKIETSGLKLDRLKCYDGGLPNTLGTGVDLRCYSSVKSDPARYQTRFVQVRSGRAFTYPRHITDSSN